MAGVTPAVFADRPWIARLLSAPVGHKTSAVVGALVMLAGASYCFLKGLLLNGAPTASFALSWGAVTLLPWLAAWEANKFVLRRVPGARRQARAVASVMLGALVWTGLGEWLLFAPSRLTWPALIGLHAIHHFPEIATVGLLTVIASYAATPREARSVGPGASLGDDANIVWARSAGNYVEFKIGQSITLRRTTLKQVEARLDPSRYTRINRFAVINRSHVVGRMHGGRIRLSDGSEHKVGDAYRAAWD